MVRSQHCFLCPKGKGFQTLHRFPKDPNIRFVWMNFCNLTEKDNVTNLFLCSSHFTSNDHIEPRAKELGSRLRLKPKTVPSLLKSKPNVQKAHTVLSAPINVPSTSKVQEQGFDVQATITGQNPKRKRFFEPRYVGEILSSDVSTPSQAEKSLHLAQTKISQQSKKIKLLQQKNRRLVAKIKTFKDLVDHLKKKNLLTENSGDHVLLSCTEGKVQLGKFNSK